VRRDHDNTALFPSTSCDHQAATGMTLASHKRQLTSGAISGLATHKLQAAAGSAAPTRNFGNTTTLHC
jgi:hypothetical protein